ncbi:MAG: hypothetical protein C4583_04230 [Anaerolineaceae bacterium]|nr:MAG: hypothetical protein C4583_04230 [Anaerolineaceae bacterium]
MAVYANQTSVSPDRSRAEIERTLQRYGATGFMYGWSERGAVIGFMLNGRQYRAVLEIPARDAFRKSERGRSRTVTQMSNAHEQALRQRWRALALVIKAKLEAVNSNISTVETEFLPWMVLPNGQTVGQWMMPQLDAIYQSGKMPPLLPGGDESVDGEVVGD